MPEPAPARMWVVRDTTFGAETYRTYDEKDVRAFNNPEYHTVHEYLRADAVRDLVRNAFAYLDHVPGLVLGGEVSELKHTILYIPERLGEPPVYEPAGREAD